MSALNISLITSFSVKGQSEIDNYFPKAVKFVEAYSFMHSDIGRLFKKYPATKSSQLAVLSLANAAHNLSAIKDIAADLHKRFTPKQIIGLATYLPEIMAHKGNTPAIEHAQKALIFLVQVAQRLKSVHDHPVSFIELVGGSRVNGVWCGEEHKREVYVMNRLTRDQAIEELLRRLEVVAAAAAKAPKVYLAIELEPGPLFTISDKTSLEQLCDQIPRAGAPIATTVGVNLDIPHWAFLAGIDVEWIEKRPNIFNRIIHSHICDHSKGHFGDNLVGAFHIVEEFIPWLKLIRKRCADQTTSGLPYSGFISYELEAFKFSAGIADGPKGLREILNKAYIPRKSSA